MAPTVPAPPGRREGTVRWDGSRVRTAKEERLRVIGALHDLAQPSSVKVLMDDIKVETDLDEVKERLRAVANIPVENAVEELIRFAAAHGRGQGSNWRAPLREALRYALRYDAGNSDPDTWRAWWRENRKGFDFLAAAADRARERKEEAEKDEKRKERDGKRRRKDDGKRKK